MRRSRGWCVFTRASRRASDSVQKCFTIYTLDLLDLTMLGFERWQSANKGLPLGSVIYHLGSIDGVEASRMKVAFD